MPDHDSSILHLKRVDPVLAEVIERVGPCRLEPRSEGTHFDALVRSIVYQQLSGKAASTILSRVHALYGNRSPTPAELLATPDETLRAAGLSRQKLSYLKDLAAKVEGGEGPLTADEMEPQEESRLWPAEPVIDPGRFEQSAEPADLNGSCLMIDRRLWLVAFLIVL